MKQTILLFILKDDSILLARKKCDFGTNDHLLSKTIQSVTSERALLQ